MSDESKPGAGAGENGQPADAKSPDAPSTPSDVQPAQFGSLDAADAAGGPGSWSLELVQDIPVTLSVEVGRSSISIRHLLQLGQGSVVELDRLAGEPLDVFVNGCLVAHGEVVVVNEKFGLRLTDIVSPSTRIKNLH